MNILDLNNFDLAALKNANWKFITFYQADEEGKNTLAFRKAVETAQTRDLQTGLRYFTKSDVTYWELWEKC